MKDLAELGIVLAAALSPIFLFASKIDFDEFEKSGTGLALAGIVVAIYRTYKNKQEAEPVEEK